MPGNSSKLRGKPISVDEFASLIDVTPDRIRQYIKQGMPIFDRGVGRKAHVLSSYDCIWWLVEAEKRNKAGALPANPQEPDTKSRIAETKVALAELTLAKQRGTLFDFNDWLPYIKDKMVVFRQSMATVAINTREKYGNDVAKYVDRQITLAINAYHRGLDNVPNEAKE